MLFRLCEILHPHRHDGFWGDIVLSDIHAKQRGVILKRRNTVGEEGSDGGSRQHNPAPTEVAGKETSEGGLLKCYSFPQFLKSTEKFELPEKVR